MKFQIIISALLFGALLMFSACGDSGLDPKVNEPEKEEEKELEMENTENNDEDLVAAPDFSLKTYDGEELKLEDYNENVLVIWFFGSECPPCIGVGPTIEEKLNKDFRGKENYSIIGIDQWDRNNATVEGFKKTTGIEFPLGAMGSGVAKDFETSYDRLVVINKSGKIAYKAEGRASGNVDDVVELVNKLVN